MVACYCYQRFDGLLASHLRNVGIQTCQCRPEIPQQHRLALPAPAERPLRPDGLGVVRVGILPAEFPEMLGKRLLKQPVFTVDSGYHDLPL